MGCLNGTLDSLWKSALWWTQVYDNDTVCSARSSSQMNTIFVFFEEKIKSPDLPLSWIISWTVRTLFKTNLTIKSLADPLDINNDKMQQIQYLIQYNYLRVFHYPCITLKTEQFVWVTITAAHTHTHTVAAASKPQNWEVVLQRHMPDCFNLRYCRLQLWQELLSVKTDFYWHHRKDQEGSVFFWHSFIPIYLACKSWAAARELPEGLPCRSEDGYQILTKMLK